MMGADGLKEKINRSIECKKVGYTDSIDFKSKQEAERSLDRFFLINIDEFTFTSLFMNYPL